MINLPRYLAYFSFLTACVLLLASQAHGVQANSVGLVQTPNGWQLHRDGKPYYINGAGGPGSLKLLAECGGNSSRTWGVDDIDETLSRLDEAQRNGISVAFGIWIEHERHGKLSYDDEQALARQVELTMSHVRRFKDHPAILVWGIGNEMEGEKGDNPAIWKHLEQIARLIKKEDPHHPVMTVVAEIGGEKVKAIHQLCPNIDIVGINSYGGTVSLPERYRAAGGSKPYIVTEFGPPGTWEVPKNSFGAIEEPTSTEKAAFYQSSLKAIKSDQELCLGSYAFLWGNKQEGTATWFGLLLPDGRKTAAVDSLTELWNGGRPDNLCPRIDQLLLVGKNEVEKGSVVKARLTAHDPEDNPLNVGWVLMADASTYVTGGDFQKSPPSFPDSIDVASQSDVEILAPQQPGVYRIYAYVDDNSGGSAVGNVVFRVKQEQEAAIAGKATEIPQVVYDEPATAAPYAPSGWMGTTRAIKMDESCTDNPKFGDHCLKFQYTYSAAWGGVVWQNPPDDWGDKDGGYDLSAANQLSFWARGKHGGEKIKFGYGLLGSDKKFFDTSKKETDEIELTTEWKRYTLDLTNANLKRIKTGFYWTLAGQGTPLTFYLDRIVFDKVDAEPGQDK